MKFSERKGYKEVSKVIQKDGMTDDLRNSLWNTFYRGIYKGLFSISHLQRENYEYLQFELDNFVETVFVDFLKIPLPDSIYYSSEIEKYFLKKFDWFEVYDFIEFTCQHFSDNELIPEEFNKIFERELAGFRIINNTVTDITSEKEIEMLEDAFADEDFPTVNVHLKRALELLSDRKKPDYRNSIKESISAVESLAKQITGQKDAELGKALAVLEKTGKIHRALKSAFLNLYGYTSGENGIRHALMDEPNLTADDAKYFLLTCTSFINYLKTKM